MLENIEFNIDSLHIKSYTNQIHIIKDFIEQNNLKEYYNKNSNNQYGKYIVKYKNTILFQYFKQTSQYSSFQDYIMIETHGLKKYNKEDKLKKKHLIKLFIHLKESSIQYDIQKLDYAIDIKDKILENIFIYKHSKRNKFNNIIEHNIRLNPFILENHNAYNTNRNNRLIAYDKSFKENIHDEQILRIEISLYPNVFRQIRKLDNPSIIYDEIVNYIEKYQIHILEDEQQRNELVNYHKEKDYKTNQRVKHKIDKLLENSEYQIIQYKYDDIEELLCYM